MKIKFCILNNGLDYVALLCHISYYLKLYDINFRVHHLEYSTLSPFRPQILWASGLGHKAPNKSWAKYTDK